MLILNARFLGPEGLGTIGLIVLSITIVLLFSNLFNTSIIYFFSRKSKTNLLILGYIWSFISIAIVWLIQQVFSFFPEEFEFHIYALSLLQSLVVVHFNLMLGEQKIKTYNNLSLIQSALGFSTVIIAYFIMDYIEVEAFIYGLFIAYSLVWILSIFSSFQHLKEFESKAFWNDFKESIQYGIYIQSSNIFQLLNYRIAYYILDAYSGRAAIGIYASGVQLSEALLLPAKSISTVQYSRISARQNEAYAQRVSILFMKFSILITGLGTLFLICIPSSVFILVLGEGFEGVRPTIFALSLGIVALSAEIILSHYFSGTGKQKKNTISSFLGLLITLISASILIPIYGAIGAALSASLAFLSMFLFLFYNMTKTNGINAKLFLPQKSDWLLFRRLLSKSKILN